MNTKYDYVVIKEGVYRHEIIGVYTKATLAETRACEFIKAEHDDYHSVCIYKCPLNQPIEDGELYAIVRRKDETGKWENGRYKVLSSDVQIQRR